MPSPRPVTEVIAWIRRRMIIRGDVDGYGYSVGDAAPLQLYVRPGADAADYPARVGGWPIQLLIPGLGIDDYVIVSARGQRVEDPTSVDRPGQPHSRCA